jgi:hypothetical protein
MSKKKGYVNSIEPFSVKIVDSLSGSGVLVKINEEICYLVTARHNFKIEKNTTFIDVDINLLKERLDSIEIKKDKISLIGKIDKLLFYDEKYDLLVFSIREWSEYLKNLETISINVDYNEENKFFFYGYPNDNKGTPRGDLTHQGHVEEENYIFRLERVKDDDDDFLSGFSGSGVFTKNGNSYSLIGIFIRFEEEKGKYYYAVDVGKIINEIQKKLPINFLLYNDEVLKQSKEKKVKNKLPHIIYRDGYIEPRTVYIEELDIHVAVCPITFEEYDFFCEDRGISDKPNDYNWGRKERPAIDVSWNNAVEYCNWLSSKDNKNYRLLTSEEWIAIAKRDIPIKGFKKNIVFSKKKISIVASKKIGLLGLYDFIGNTYEWCDNNCIQGISFSDNISLYSDLFNEIMIQPSTHKNNIGFRIVSSKII